MQTPSILTQVSAPTPPSKVNNGSNDLSKTNVDKNTPSSFKKMLNGEVNQQQKLRNDAANKNKEPKKIEQQSNAVNEKNSKIEASNKDKSIKPEADKPVEDSLEEVDASNSNQDILNFVANIGLLNEQIQTKFASSNDSKNIHISQISSEIERKNQDVELIPLSEKINPSFRNSVDTLLKNDVSNTKDAVASTNKDAVALTNKDAVALTNKDAVALTNKDAVALTNKDAVALTNKDAVALTNKDQPTQINQRNIANNFDIAKENAKLDSNLSLDKIDYQLSSAPPINASSLKAKDVVDALPNSNKFISGSNEKNSKINIRLEISDAVASNTKDVSSKVQFENHIKNTLNTQLQSPPIELDNKTSQDFSAIKVDAMTAQQLGTAPDQVKASAIANYIPAQLGSKAWDQAMGQRIIWMVAGGEQSAQLSLNPPELGPLQVVLKISDNQVDASFISSHLDVRETIESAMPKLRQMMEDAGIQLSGFSVDSQAAQTGKQFSQEQSQQRVREVASTSEITTHSVDNTSRSSIKKEIGLVDTFV